MWSYKCRLIYYQVNVVLYTNYYKSLSSKFSPSNNNKNLFHKGTDRAGPFMGHSTPPVERYKK